MASSAVSKLPRSLHHQTRDSAVLTDSDDSDHNNNDNAIIMVSSGRHHSRSKHQQQDSSSMQCDSNKNYNPAVEDDHGTHMSALDVDFDDDDDLDIDIDDLDDDDDDSDEFRLTIPLLSGETLASMDQTVLRECLEPVMQSLRQLDAAALLHLHQVENGARLCDGVNVRPIHDDVHPRYESPEGMSFVRYIHITEVPEQYSVGIFVFPPFSRIPLHDHPEMCVISRLLYGDLQCLSLDLLDDDDLLDEQQNHDRQTYGSLPAHPQRQQQLPPGLPAGSRRVWKNPIRHLHAPEVSMLFPYKGNLHEFYAGPHGAAVLDILLPPYDANHDRDCTFYDVREDVGPSLAAAAASPNLMAAMMMDVDPSSLQSTSSTLLHHPAASRTTSTTSNLANPNDGGRVPCWIVPTDQPHDFHCLSGKYRKLGTHVISMQDGG